MLSIIDCCIPPDCAVTNSDNCAPAERPTDRELLALQTLPTRRQPVIEKPGQFPRTRNCSATLNESGLLITDPSRMHGIPGRISLLASHSTRRVNHGRRSLGGGSKTFRELMGF